jgi:Uma2 family endonuclease
MSEPYEEMVAGETMLRLPPGVRHELLCTRLHSLLIHCLSGRADLEVRAPRSVIELAMGTLLRPDLAVVNASDGSVWLAIEVVSSEDHRADTVVKKAVYEDSRIPRLWMVDPRYDNVEVYHTSEYGLMLKAILAGRELLTDDALPGFHTVIHDLFHP